ncbi:helix-turn-helix domain-containing protein [Streptomyces sp. NPDC006872]|uniref:helix-turn-helix domain-containing protein n=1 Tax=Streptomyces sp. NPDC006872 TaxID=3155720 RepID=UPI0033D2635F
MPVAPACPTIPTAAERERLKRTAYGHKIEHRLRIRAQVVLHAAQGRSNARIAHETGLHWDTVRVRRGRFARGRLRALADRRRSGRPALFTPVQVAEAKAPTCRLPAETGVPLSRWSCPELGPVVWITPQTRGVARPSALIQRSYGVGTCGCANYLLLSQIRTSPSA